MPYTQIGAEQAANPQERVWVPAGSGSTRNITAGSPGLPLQFLRQGCRGANQAVR